MSLHQLILRETLTGELPDWCPDIEQAQRWCFKGGGGGQTQETKTNNEPWVGQQGYLKDVYANAQSQFQSSTPSYYPGSTLADFTPSQQMAMDKGVVRSLTGSGLQRAGQEHAYDTLQGDYLRDGNPYMKAVSDNVMSQVLPGVASQFSGAGRLYSGLAGDTAARAATQAISPYAFGTYNNERNRMDRLAQAAPGMAAADYQDINALMTIGGQQQAQEQAEINAGIEEWNYNQNLPAAKLAQYSNLLGAPVGGIGTTTTTQSGGKGGGIGSLLSGAGSLLGGSAAAYTAFGGAPSDRRIKRDISRIGQLASGLAVYLFRYIWSDDWNVGVMAQEAEKIFPDAVFEVDGIKVVDYARIG